MSRVQEAPSNAPIAEGSTAVIRSLSARKTRDVMVLSFLKPENWFASSFTSAWPTRCSCGSHPSTGGERLVLLDGGDDVIGVVITAIGAIGEHNPAGCPGMGIIAVTVSIGG